MFEVTATANDEYMSKNSLLDWINEILELNI
jgi:hypothetical protein